MLAVNTPDAECTACHYPLDANYEGPCPKCGDTRKNVFLRASAPISVSATAKLSVWYTYSGYWTKNKVWQLLNGCIGVITVLLTIYIGLLGFAIGFFIFIGVTVFLICYIISCNEQCKGWFLSHIDYKIKK
jgi:hypothetical protein